MKKLMVIAGALIAAAAVGATLVSTTDHSRIENTDFVNFYAAASIMRSGNGANLYQPQTQQAALRSILGRDSTQYFLHPAFEATILAPLSRLTVEHAFVLWTAFNVAVLALLPLVLMPCVPLVARRPYLGLLGFCFLPALTAITLGQDSILLLFVLSLSYRLLSKQEDFAAGLILALMAVKFQYLIVLILLFVVARKYRTVGGVGVGCLCLALLSFLATGWRGLLDYPRFVLDFNAHLGYGGLKPSLMVNVRGFVAGIGVEQHSLFYAMVGAAVLLGLSAACALKTTPPPKKGLLFAVFVAVALVASPYAHFPDMTILLLPILVATDWITSNWRRSAGTNYIRFGSIAIACACVFLGPAILVLLGGHYWWNSRIYLLFPLIVFLIVTLTTELYFGETHGQSQNNNASLVAR
jgi:hypothetical protein